MRTRGSVAYMARNGVASNLLLFFVVVAGLASAGSLVQEVFPEFSLDTISVSVAYPGATPEEVEESIVRKIEEQIKAVEGIKEITATASEGVANVSVELKLGTDVSRALDDIKAEVDQIVTFPEGAERPEVRELTTRQSVVRLAVFGDAPERTIKEVAYRVEDALSELPEVSYVETSGIRPYEISIEVSEARLRALGLTLAQVADAVRQGSLDLSAGTIKTSDEQVRIRTLGQNYEQADFEDIIVVSAVDGTTLRLGEIATVRDGFADTDLETSYNGSQAAVVEVFRTSDERVLEIVAAVERALEEDILASLPEGVELEIWENSAVVLEGRLGLLAKNAILGLLLVLVALTLFLDLRLAFWTAVGIGVSFVGTLAVMLLLGVSINVLSLFGFILAVGIVVDDAIVVGENIFAERERGTGPLEAAVRGAQRIRGPVTFAVLTTVVAFAPLLAVPGTLGKILGSIPVVVIAVLLLSLVESLFILPNHLSHLPPPHHSARNRVARFFERTQSRVDARLKAFVNGPLERGLRFATRNPSVVMAGATALIVLSIASVPAGLVRVSFFPEVGGDVVTARLEMPEGTPVERTREVAERLRAAAERAALSLEGERPAEAARLVEAIYSTVGALPAGGGPGGSGGGGVGSASVAGVQVKLLEAEQRGMDSKVFEDRWRDEMGLVPEARSLSFSSSLVGAGSPVQVELAHPEPEALDALAAEVMAELGRFEGVFEIQSDADAGLKEVQLVLRPEARTLDLTLDGVARQVRAAFFGQEALRVQRGREDVRVYVRLPEGERDEVADVEGYRIRTAGGGEIPLERVADVSLGTSPTTINRKDGQRVQTITARVDEQVVSGPEVNAALESTILPALRATDPRLAFRFGGEAQERTESFGSLGRGFILALFVIYALLAIPFRSYSQPLVIMSAIPFGIVGAIIGHLLLGLPVGLLSLFGIIGLSGVVVNDSLVMIDFINERRTQGADPRESIVEGAKARFRPILLTSLTTFLGVAPLVFERSVQAQFLIPMAASLGFGIVFATAILMLVVPALMALQVGFGEWWSGWREARWQARQGAVEARAGVATTTVVLAVAALTAGCGRAPGSADAVDAGRAPVIDAGGQYVSVELRPSDPDAAAPHPDPEVADRIRFGHRIARDTRTHAPEFVGNSLSCANCHLNAGQRVGALPWVGIAGMFPQFRAREGASVTLHERIAGCFMRSLNGAAPPEGHPVAEALAAYIVWLSRDVPTGEAPTWHAAARVPEGERLAVADLDPEAGRVLFEAQCALCHGTDGSGVEFDGQVPGPLWGPDSWNDGAGAARIWTLAAFIQRAMPLNAPGSLSWAEAQHVAAWINRQDRPAFAAKDADYPAGDRPVDAVYDTLVFATHPLRADPPSDDGRDG